MATIKLLTDHKGDVIVWRVQIPAKVAQLVEHSTENAGVVGSIPSLGTFCFWTKERQLLERPQFV